MASGDKNPGKVDGFANGVSKPSPDEFLSPDESNIIQPDGDLVHSELTYPYIEYTLKKQLVVSYLTNNRIIDIDLDRELVNCLLTFISCEKASKILAYVCKYKVWLMPNLWRTLKVTKTHGYEVINLLIRKGLLKKTLIKVEPPNPNVKGSRPRVYTWAHLEVNNAMDPRVQEARQRYWDNFRQYDPEAQRKESTDNLLNQISTLTVDYYKGRGQIGKEYRPEVRDVKKYIREVYPDEFPKFKEQLHTFSQEIVRILHYADRSPQVAGEASP